MRDAPARALPRRLEGACRPALLAAAQPTLLTMLLAALVAAPLAVLLPASALASAGVRSVDLATAVQQADVIAIVSARPEGTATLRILFPKLRTPEGKAVPAFERRDRGLRLVEVLIRRRGPATPRQLRVAPASWTTRLTVHRRYHAERVRKIPLYRRLEGGRAGLAALANKGGQAIVLLRANRQRKGDPAGYRFAVGMGALPVSRLAEVRRLLLGATPKTRPRPRPRTAGPLRDVAWLAGTWRGGLSLPADNSDAIEEAWSAARGGTMLGTNRTLRAQQTVAFEFLRIEAAKKGADGRRAVSMVAQPAGRSPGTRFSLTEARPGDVAFTNLRHDFPQRIRYRLVGKGRLRIEVTGDGRPLVFELKR